MKTSFSLVTWLALQGCCITTNAFLSSTTHQAFQSSAITKFNNDMMKSNYKATSRRNKSELNMSVPNPLDIFTSGLTSMARLPYGVTIADNLDENRESRAKARITALYDMENSRACRKVRERITELDLVVERVIPSAPNSRVFTDNSYQYTLGQGAVDEGIPKMVVSEMRKSNGSWLEIERTFRGSDDILKYLDKKFGPVDPSKTMALSSNNLVPETQVEEMKAMALEAFDAFGSIFPPLLRFGRGSEVASCATSPSTPRPSENKPLVLYSYEGNQFCRLVREVLTELDIVYELRSCGKGSKRREELASLTGGSTQCPYLIDPNTDVQMAESAEIVKYLYKNYALWTPPNELLQVVSTIITPWLKPVYSMLAPLQAGSNRDDKAEYETDMAIARKEIEADIASDDVVVYTYKLSPFCSEATKLLDNLDIKYKEVSLGLEWIPGMIQDPAKRAALGEMTGQTSLPHIFVGGKSIGGLFSGSPGLVPSLEDGTFWKMIEEVTGEVFESVEEMKKEAGGIGGMLEGSFMSKIMDMVQ